MKHLTLFQAGMGKFDHGTIHLSVAFTEVGLGSPKLVTLFLSRFDLSQKTNFWNFFPKFFENWILRFLGVFKHAKKNWIFLILSFFCRNSHFFLLNHYFKCSQLSLEVFDSFVDQNLNFWCILLEVSVLTKFTQGPFASRIYFIWD